MKNYRLGRVRKLPEFLALYALPVRFDRTDGVIIRLTLSNDKYITHLDALDSVVPADMLGRA